MSFIKTLATLAVGLAAAKGFERFQKAGGLANLQTNLKGAGAPGGMADSIGGMAEKMGLPGATETVRGMFGTAGGAAAEGTAAAQAGFGSLMTAIAGATAAGTGMMGDMVASMTGGTPAGQMMEGQAKLMIRAMIEAAKADGVIDAAEQARITDHIKDSGPEEIAYVQALLAAPIDMDGLVAATDATMRSQVYSASLMAMRVDTPVERAYLAQLATALGLDAAARDAIHTGLGLGPLAS